MKKYQLKVLRESIFLCFLILLKAILNQNWKQKICSQPIKLPKSMLLLSKRNCVLCQFWNPSFQDIRLSQNIETLMSYGIAYSPILESIILLENKISLWVNQQRLNSSYQRISQHLAKLLEKQLQLSQLNNPHQIKQLLTSNYSLLLRLRIILLLHQMRNL